MKDIYQTATNVAKYMVGLIPENVVTVLEPTKGLGRLVFELKLKNFNVTAPDDYFLLNKNKKFDAIVMNPPFSGKSLIDENAPKNYLNLGMKVGYKILFDCMQKSNIIISLMPWYTISDSDVRIRALKKYGLKSITVLPRKTFQYARIQTCVLELRKDWNKPTLFYVFEFMNNNKEYKENKLF